MVSMNEISENDRERVDAAAASRCGRLGGAHGIARASEGALPFRSNARRSTISNAMKRAISLAPILFAALGCGGNVVVDPGSGGGSTNTGATFACGDQTCLLDTQMCVHIPPVQPPPEGDGIDVYECTTISPTCGTPTTCSCAGTPIDCINGVDGCSMGADGTLTLECFPQ